MGETSRDMKKLPQLSIVDHDERQRLLDAGVREYDLLDFEPDLPRRSSPSYLTPANVDAYVDALWGREVSRRVVVCGWWDGYSSRAWRSIYLPSTRWPSRCRERGPLIAALRGGIDLAVAPGPTTRHLCIDIDAHGGEDPWPRYHAVVAALGLHGRHILLATPRHGLHVLALLRRAMVASRVSSWATSCLAAARIKLAAGRIEVYPAGDRAIRVPGCRGSLVIDPDTGELPFLRGRRHDRKGQFLWLLDRFDALPRISLPDLPAQDRKIIQNHKYVLGGSFSSHKPARSGSEPAIVDTFRWSREVAEIDRVGVRSPGQRWEDVGKLVLGLAVAGRSVPEIVAHMTGWLRRTNGGASKTLARRWRWPAQLKEVERFATKLVGTRVGERVSCARPMAAHEWRIYRARASKLGWRRYWSQIRVAIGWIVPRSRGGMPVQIHCRERWVRWAGRLEYQQLRAMVVRIVGMGKVSGYVVGVRAQPWVREDLRFGSGVVGVWDGRAVKIEDGRACWPEVSYWSLKQIRRVRLEELRELARRESDDGIANLAATEREYLLDVSGELFAGPSSAKAIPPNDAIGRV